MLAGDYDWFFISDSEGKRKRLYDKKNDPQELVDVAAEHPELVAKYWRILEDEAGGTLPQFSRKAGKACSADDADAPQPAPPRRGHRRRRGRARFARGRCTGVGAARRR